MGFVDWVYIVPHGARVGGNPIFVADKVSPELDVEWSGLSLTIRARSARVFTSEPEANVGASVVPIRVVIATPER